MKRLQSMRQQSVGLSRLQIIGWGLCIVGALITLRLFYVQVIRHGSYAELAQAEQTKKFEIPAKRGEILARDGEELVPLVLNEPAFTVFADPRYIDKPEQTAKKLAKVLKTDETDLEKKLSSDGAYVVLAQKADKKLNDRIEKLKLKGIGSTEVSRRVYPEGQLAAHVLGFVNNDGEGQYGIEQALNKQVGGVPGQLNGATDVRGIPIATEDSVIEEPKDGDDIVLTLDRSAQTQAEFFLQKGLKKFQATSGSIMVMNPNNGRIIAMANAPTFKPSEYANQKDNGVFQNRIVTSAYEPGSVVKVFTMSAALNEGAVTPNTTYTDYSKRKIDGYTIRNTGPVVTKTRTMTEVIARSANTGTIFALEKMGGGDINDQAKKALYGYFTDRFRFGVATGVEQTGESAGFVLKPLGAPDVNYANMTFGQGVSMTMLQLASGLSAIATDGVYYKPTLVESYRDSDGKMKQHKPVVVAENIIKKKTAQQVKVMMEGVVKEGTATAAAREGYRFAVKTGTAEVAKPGGGYYDDREIGSAFGITPIESSEYVIIVRVDNPKFVELASSAAVPIYADMNNWLVDYYGIEPTEKK